MKNKKKEFFWKTKKGKKIKLSEMTDPHLLNSFLLVTGRIKDLQKLEKILKEEIDSRASLQQERPGL